MTNITALFCIEHVRVLMHLLKITNTWNGEVLFLLSFSRTQNMTKRTVVLCWVFTPNPNDCVPRSLLVAGIICYSWVSDVDDSNMADVQQPIETDANEPSRFNEFLAWGQIFEDLIIKRVCVFALTLYVIYSCKTPDSHLMWTPHYTKVVLCIWFIILIWNMSSIDSKLRWWLAVNRVRRPRQVLKDRLDLFDLRSAW